MLFTSPYQRVLIKQLAQSLLREFLFRCYPCQHFLGIAALVYFANKGKGESAHSKTPHPNIFQKAYLLDPGTNLAIRHLMALSLASLLTLETRTHGKNATNKLRNHHGLLPVMTSHFMDSIPRPIPWAESLNRSPSPVALRISNQYLTSYYGLMSRKEFSPHNGHHPHWHREHVGEHRYPVAVVVFFVIALQTLLPRDLSLNVQTEISIAEALLLVILLIIAPRRIHNHQMSMRYLSLGLTGVMTLSNTASAIKLIDHLVSGGIKSGTSLLVSGASIWLTNIIIFALRKF